MEKELLEKLNKMLKIQDDIDRVKEMEFHFVYSLLTLFIGLFCFFVVYFLTKNLTEENIASGILGLFFLSGFLYRIHEDNKHKKLILKKYMTLENALIQLRLDYDNVLHTVTNTEIETLKKDKYNHKKLKKGHDFVIKDLLTLKGLKKRNRIVDY